MHSIASYMDFDFKLLQQCGFQTKPLGSLRWNLQVEGMNRADPGGNVGNAPAIFNSALNKISSLFRTSSK